MKTTDKICIMGFGPTKDVAPLDDPSWTFLGLPWDANWRRYDRLYEMHSQDVLQLSNSVVITEEWDGGRIVTQAHRPQNYFAILKEIAGDKNKTLYMQDNYFGGVVPYPFDKVVKATRDYFISSVTYMISHAISLEPKTLAVYGIDLSGNDEWAYQRACVEYLLGLAEGRGIEVIVPDDSWLLKFQPERVRFGAILIEYHERYGMLGPQPQKFERWV